MGCTISSATGIPVGASMFESVPRANTSKGKTYSAAVVCILSLGSFLEKVQHQMEDTWMGVMKNFLVGTFFKLINTNTHTHTAPQTSDQTPLCLSQKSVDLHIKQQSNPHWRAAISDCLCTYTLPHSLTQFPYSMM